MTGIQKFSAIILAIIAAVSVGFALWFFFGSVVEETIGKNEEPVATSYMLFLSYVLFFLAAAITLIFAFANILRNKKSLKGALLVIVFTAILIAIAYSLASPVPLAGKEEMAPITFKLVDTGLYITYILGPLAFLGIIFTEIYRSAK